MLAIALVTPAAAQWRLEQGTIDAGATSAASARYRVEGCVDMQPAGVAASAHHTVYSGCGATAVRLPGEPGGPVSVAAVPTLSTPGWLLLLVVLASLAVHRLRRMPVA